MDASLAATGMFDVLATRVVLIMTGTSRPFTDIFNLGKSSSTSAISLPRSPHPTYTITSEFEYFERLWDMTVLPQPKAPGTQHVPPLTDGNIASSTRCPVISGYSAANRSSTGRG